MIVNRRELKYPISEVDYYKVDNLFKDVLKEDKNNKGFGYKLEKRLDLEYMTLKQRKSSLR